MNSAVPPHADLLRVSQGRASSFRVLKPERAKELGYASVTQPYAGNAAETAMLERAMAAYAGCDVVLVRIPCQGIEIWRHKSQVREIGEVDPLPAGCSRGATGHRRAHDEWKGGASS